MKTSGTRYLAAALALALTLAGCGADESQAQAPAPVAAAVPVAPAPVPTPVVAAPEPVNAPVLPLAPDYRLEGQSMAELSAQWWQWAMSSPTQENPVEDATGEHCAVNQQGPAWFLAGGFGSSKIRRRCVVPAGKHLFFPAVNMVYYPKYEHSNVTCAEAQAGAALNNDSALDVFLTIDGQPVADTQRYRVRTTDCFNVFARVPAQYGAPDAFPSASDGYWFLLPPLARGEHVLKFGGRYVSGADDYGNMVQDIEYRLVVE